MSDAGDATETKSSTPQRPAEGKGFLEERPGHNSAIRAMSVAAFFCALGFGIVTLLYSAVEETGAYITFGFLLAASAPKAPQKFAEETIVA